MLYDVHYSHCDGEYTITESACEHYVGRYASTVYDDGYDWYEYGISQERIEAMGLAVENTPEVGVIL